MASTNDSINCNDGESGNDDGSMKSQKKSRGEACSISEQVHRQNYTCEKLWPKLEQFIHGIFVDKKYELNDWFEMVHTINVTMVFNYRGCVELEDRSLALFGEHMAQAREAILATAQDDQTLLSQYKTAYAAFSKQNIVLPHLFDTIDQADIIQRSCQTCGLGSEPRLSTRVCLLREWYENMFSQLKDSLINASMELIFKERCVQQVPYQPDDRVMAVKNTCLELEKGLNEQTDTKFYHELYVTRYLETTENFYQSKGVDQYNKSDLLGYLNLAEVNFEDELARTEHYLEEAERPMVKTAMVQALIVPYLAEYTEKFVQLLEQKDFVNLKTLLRHMERAGQASVLTDSFQRYYYDKGYNLLRQLRSNDAEGYFDACRSVYHESKHLIDISFDDDARFNTARDLALKDFMNNEEWACLHKGSKQAIRAGRVAELFAFYSDMLLKDTKLANRLGSEGVEKQLNDLCLLLKYIEDKDLFACLYKNALIRRIIQETSSDSGKEEQMVHNFGQVGISGNYINTMRNMFQELKVSEDFDHEIREIVPCNVSVRVLKMYTWVRMSTYEKVTLTYPPEIESAMGQIKAAYQSMHSGKKLTWHPPLTTAEVIFYTHDKQYTLKVTCYQAVVLYAWNNEPDDKVLSFDALLLATQIPKQELARTLWSLVDNPKLRGSQVLLLNEADMDRVKHASDINDSTGFKVNYKFTARGVRVDLIGRLQICDRILPEEVEEVASTRLALLEATVQQVLKEKKTVMFDDLYLSTAEKLRWCFVVSRDALQKGLDVMAQNTRLSWVKRDDVQRNRYHFSPSGPSAVVNDEQVSSRFDIAYY